MRAKDQEQQRGAELRQHSKEIEAKEIASTRELENVEKDLNTVRQRSEGLLDRNYELKQELDALNRHSELLQGQNFDLQRELDSFVEADDVIRKNLDRKEKVYMIRSQVDNAIKRSTMEVIEKSPSRRRRSPERGRRDSPDRTQVVFN